MPGSRTAVNISGIALEQIQRGNVIAHPGDYRPTQRIDVRFKLLPDVSQPLKHNTEVKLFIDTSEVVARLRLLGVDELSPGQEGWLQLELHQPVVTIRGDRYILRRPSPGETLGGGMVVDPHPKERHKRFASEALADLAALSKGTPDEILLQALNALGAAPLKEVMVRANLDMQTAGQALAELVKMGQIVNLEEKQISADAADFGSDDLVLSRQNWDRLSQRLVAETQAYHRSYPLRRGIPREELKSRLKDLTRSSARLFNVAMRRLVAEASLNEAGPLVLMPGHAIQFSPQQQAKIDRLLTRFAASPYSPPSVKDCQAEVGEDVLAALVDTGQVVAVAPDVVFRQADYQRMLGDIRDIIQQRGSITVADARDHFNTSRRYILAFLEYLDSVGITIRQGDDRRLKS